VSGDKEDNMSLNKKVLVVDDEPDFATIVQKNLEKEGFTVDVAYNGVEGLEKVRANPPDAIVLDVMMPEKDGYQVCKELKGDEKTRDIPVILLTAVASHVTSTRYTHRDGMETEADDYISKPASAEEITKSLKRLLKL
jgi:two-component system, OmpR family, alkaline phosphatase synthesis response regulator PhoP